MAGEDDKYYLTKMGLQRIKKEYQNLLKAREIRIKKEAPPFLHSEEVNADFISFREDFENLETRIEELDHILKNCEIIRKPSRERRNRV